MGIGQYWRLKMTFRQHSPDSIFFRVALPRKNVLCAPAIEIVKIPENGK
jgi:hypothetical protein